MKVKKLIDALEIVKDISKSAASTKEETNRIPTILLFSKKYVIANSNKGYICTRFRHGIKDCIIPFNTLYSLLSMFKEDKEIEIEEKDNGIIIRWSTGKKQGKTTIAKVKDKQLKFIKTPKNGWQPINEEIIKAISKCKISLPKESLNPKLGSFGIKKHFIFTSDDIRLSRFKVKNLFGEDANFLLSKSAGDFISERKAEEYILNDGFIDLKTKNIFARFSSIDGTFPDIKENIFSGDLKIKIDKKQMIEALERSALFADGETEIDMSLNIFFDKNKFKIEAKNKYGQNIETGQLKNKINQHIEIDINPFYLLQILKALSKRTIIIAIDKEKRLKFKEDNFNHLLCSYISK